SKLHLRVKIGGRPLMIPATAASAIRRATSWSAQDAPRHATRSQNPSPAQTLPQETLHAVLTGHRSLLRSPNVLQILRVSSAICMHTRHNTGPAACRSTLDPNRSEESNAPRV